MRYFYIALMLIAQSSSADSFIEIGLGYGINIDNTIGKSCQRDWKKDAHEWGCSSNPLGYAAIGYEHNGFTLAVEHWSAITEYDAGIDIVSIKHRWTMK